MTTAGVVLGIAREPSQSAQRVALTDPATGWRWRQACDPPRRRRRHDRGALPRTRLGDRRKQCAVDEILRFQGPARRRRECRPTDLGTRQGPGQRLLEPPRQEVEHCLASEERRTRTSWSTCVGGWRRWTRRRKADEEMVPCRVRRPGVLPSRSRAGRPSDPIERATWTARRAAVTGGDLPGQVASQSNTCLCGAWFSCVLLGEVAVSELARRSAQDLAAEMGRSGHRAARLVADDGARSRGTQ